MEKLVERKDISMGIRDGNLYYFEDTPVKYIKQGEYGVKVDNEVLATNKIVTCCGIILDNGETQVLMHADDETDLFDVYSLLTEYIDENSKLLFVPGSMCTKVDYISLINSLSDKTSCIINQFSGSTGTIVIEDNSIIISSERGIEFETKIMSKQR